MQHRPFHQIFRHEHGFHPGYSAPSLPKSLFAGQGHPYSIGFCYSVHSSIDYTTDDNGGLCNVHQNRKGDMPFVAAFTLVAAEDMFAIIEHDDDPRFVIKNAVGPAEMFVDRLGISPPAPVDYGTVRPIEDNPHVYKFNIAELDEDLLGKEIDVGRSSSLVDNEGFLEIKVLELDEGMCGGCASSTSQSTTKVRSMSIWD